ncbi:hypothetical protein CMUS01_16437 [Colletotrichum musicola]|uniref:Uncharacterized protein n=1 Tax=Colletotrichum musicola TaxID=2175873 RepID=A0A8H6IN14_9PEZI|nr:hypothetical protein CMUS01_16437 [Colletotrichum musicola]
MLRYFNNKPLPQWPLGLTLNTAIALLATFARAAFIVPVSESLSQLKWLWYLRARPLKDFQDFDAASRGVWGSVQLAKTTKGWSPSVISMIVLLTAILTSTLTQSTVTYPTRLAPALPKPVVPRSVRFIEPEFERDNESEFYTYYYALEREYDAAIQAGLSHSHDSKFPFDQPTCPTTECVWGVVNTLGVCAKVWNITELLNVTYGPTWWTGGYAHVPNIASLPSGRYSNLSIFNWGMVTLNQENVLQHTKDLQMPKISLSYFSIIYLTDKVRAAEVMFHFCVQQYNVSVHDNVVSRELIGATADAEIGSLTYETKTKTGETTIGTDDLFGLKVPDEPGIKFPYGGTGQSWLRGSLKDAFSGTFSRIGATPSEKGRAPSRFFAGFGSGDIWDSDDALMEVIVKITDNVARSLSNMLSRREDSTNVVGEALKPETYVQVRWAWLAFISSQIVLSTVLLDVAIIMTTNAGLRVVKSSTIPAFFAVDTHDRELLRSGKGYPKQQDELDSLLKDGFGAGWKLVLTDRGWMLHGQ